MTSIQAIVCRSAQAALAFASLSLVAATPSLARPAPHTAGHTIAGGNALIQVQRGALRPVEVRRRLADRGYRRIQILENNPPFLVEACRDGELFELRVGRRGRVRNARVVGNCGRSRRFGAQSRTIRELRRSGYSRIEAVRERGNVTVFEACRGYNRERIVVERDGDIRRRRRIGACLQNRNQIAGPATGRRRPARRNVSEADARRTLSNRRYYNVRLTDTRPRRLVFEACRGIRQFRVGVDRDNGNLVGRRRIGWCERPRNRRPVRITRPQIDFNASSRLRATTCQDAFDYLLAQDKVYFSTASAEIREESVPLLRRVARVAQRCPDATLIIGGHTDSTGSDELNQELSEDRALSVVQFLRRTGISRNRVSGIGYGERRPVASNATTQGRALNRRIEFLVEWDG